VLRRRRQTILYVEGVNDHLSSHVPWELRLLRYTPEPWTIEDSILLLRMVGYLTLAQSQTEMERLIVQLVQAKLSRQKLDELFPGALDGLDESLIRQVKLGERIVPESIAWGGVVRAWSPRTIG
jgi:penicillin G amidase